MDGTVSTTPAIFAWPMAACRAVTRPLISGEISLPNSTEKAVSPQDRYRTLTSARISCRPERCEGPFLRSSKEFSHGRDQCWFRQHQLRPRRELRSVGDG